ncbi:hypothetical protein MCOR03_010369 [Pyricularia oryzae]|nr:hypothetical protein MCOR03_010369 [Pyricularia oryzae]
MKEDDRLLGEHKDHGGDSKGAGAHASDAPGRRFKSQPWRSSGHRLRRFAKYVIVAMALKYLLAALVGLLPYIADEVQGAITYPDCENGPLSTNIVCDQAATPAERAAGLVDIMELDEKLENLVNKSPGAPRIGLPAYEWWSEALHGVAKSPGVIFNKSSGAAFSSATSFSNPIVLSAAFDDELVEAVATQISTEARAFSNAGLAGLDWWTPNINPYKDPRWGRGMETPGEDALRISKYVKALLRGLEGSDPTTRKMVANCKHYAANDLERWKGVTRYNFDAPVTLQDLSEYYLPAFKQCARDSNVGSFMCAYNAMSIKGKNLSWNGTPVCASKYLMNDILREHWGWKEHNNWITSDCNAVLHMWNQHHWSDTREEAAGSAYTAGTDTVCEVSNYDKTAVKGAFDRGLLDEDVVDRALKRLYEGLVRAGYFDGPDAPYRNITWADVNTPEARKLAHRSAVEGMVLTKNNGVLPIKLEELQKKGKTVALIGNWVDNGEQMLGTYSGIAPFRNTPLAAAKALNLKVVTAGGPVNQSTGSRDSWTRPALNAARQADVVLYFGGIDLSVEAEDRDRYSLAWPSAQAKLLSDISALGKPTVVVQLGTMLDDTALLDNKNISAIIWAGYPGQDGGTAAFDIITGKTAPSGRLPVTQYPAKYANQVPMTDMEVRPSKDTKGGAASNPGRTYRWYDEAVHPFGFGLHFTNFTTSVAVSSSSAISTSDLESGCKSEKHIDKCSFPSSLEVSVTNDGKSTTSSYAALAFVRGEYGPKPYPLKTLVAYGKLHDIAPGQTKKVKLELTLGDLARTAENGDLVLYPGKYEVLVDVPTAAKASFEIRGDELVLDRFPQPKDD